MTVVTPHLILASTSPYRRELLQRLRLPFEVIAPHVDESTLPGETPAATSLRLARAKAQAVAERFPHSWVIGSDQVAELDGVAIGKPGDHTRAVRQLQAMRGREVLFHTAVALAHAASGHLEAAVVPVRVRFLNLTDAEIETYLRLEQPYDCAGSAKCEGLGIRLLDAIESDDPTALIGLPLIRTSALLRAAGIDPLMQVVSGASA